MDREVEVDGHRLLNFCSNDYLGLASDSRVRAAFKAGVERWGVGSGSSHLICGHSSIHEELEEALADFTGRERSLVYSSGYAANVGVINALLSLGDFVFEDRLNHASLLDGGWLSRATFRWFTHLDTEELDSQFKAVSKSPTRKLIVSDGTFSMDGDFCDLDSLIEVAESHSAWLMIDDAHGIGVVGNQGRGIVNPDSYSSREVHILIGTFGKALGTSGAFVAGDRPLIETLIQRSRNYIFTTAMPSAIAAATIASLNIARREEWRRERISQLIMRFRNGINHLGFSLTNSLTAIQPIIIGEPERAVSMSRELEAQGFLVTPIRPPTVPKGTSRLRITLTASHTESDVDRLIEALSCCASYVGASCT